MKFFENVDVTTNILSGGVIFSSLNLIPQGTTDTTRIGRKCTIKRIMMRGIMTNSAAADDGDVVRIIIYHDKQCNGTAATAVMILETADVKAFRNLDNSKRFTIIKDWYTAWNSHSLDVAGSGFAITRRTLSFYKNCSIPLTFDNTTGALTEIRDNNIGILFISQQADDTNLEWTSRISFSDV